MGESNPRSFLFAWITVHDHVLALIAHRHKCAVTREACVMLYVLCVASVIVSCTIAVCAVVACVIVTCAIETCTVVSCAM